MGVDECVCALPDVLHMCSRVLISFCSSSNVYFIGFRVLEEEGRINPLLFVVEVLQLFLLFITALALSPYPPLTLKSTLKWLHLRRSDKGSYAPIQPIYYEDHVTCDIRSVEGQ